MDYRTEKDLLGSVKVPSDAYYGAETQRSLDNFKVSGIRNPIELVHSYAILKKAAAIANMKDAQTFKPITFKFRGIRMTMQPDGEIDTRHH